MVLLKYFKLGLWFKADNKSIEQTAWRYCGTCPTSYNRFAFCERQSNCVQLVHKVLKFYTLNVFSHYAFMENPSLKLPLLSFSWNKC